MDDHSISFNVTLGRGKTMVRPGDFESTYWPAMRVKPFAMIEPYPEASRSIRGRLRSGFTIERTLKG
jgi:hypothetical protein